MGGRIKIRDINQDPAGAIVASGTNDPLPGFHGGLQGSIAYRGVSKWEILGPGTTGYALTTNGPAANPSWTLVVVNLVGRATGKIVTLVTGFAIPVVGVDDGSLAANTLTSSFGTVVT